MDDEKGIKGVHENDCNIKHGSEEKTGRRLRAIEQ